MTKEIFKANQKLVKKLREIGYPSLASILDYKNTDNTKKVEKIFKQKGKKLVSISSLI